MAFLAFEGIDGSGKSTLMGLLIKKLEQAGVAYIETREPGGTQLGEELRALILRDHNAPPSSKTELLLYQAIRSQHVDLKIRPALESGKWVLCDRYTASSIAFQGNGRGISNKSVEWLNSFSTGSLKPDVIVLIDLPYEEAQKRLSKRGQSFRDRIEKEKQDFHERVRKSYLDQSQAEPDNWLVLDGKNAPAELLKELTAKLGSRGIEF